MASAVCQGPGQRDRTPPMSASSWSIDPGFLPALMSSHSPVGPRKRRTSQAPGTPRQPRRGPAPASLLSSRGCPWAPEPAFPNVPLGSKQRETDFSNSQLNFTGTHSQNQWIPVSQGQKENWAFQHHCCPWAEIIRTPETRLTASTCVLHTYDTY